MLYALPRKTELTLTQRLLAIAALTALTAIAARITIPLEPVPFTFQVLAVLLAGMLLGAARRRAESAGLRRPDRAQPAAGRPCAGRGRPGRTHRRLSLRFRPHALVTGWLIERGAERAWQRWLAGAAGVVVLYACGMAGLMIATGMDLEAAWAAGVAPFLVFDLVKAALAASLLYAGRRLLLPD